MSVQREVTALASPQLEGGYVRISNELFEAIFMRNFTKRQRGILDLIIRLSYGTRRKTAYIPLSKDFRICGIPASKVRQELDTLRNLQVIGLDHEDNYWINKDYEMWLVDKPYSKAEHRLRDLLKYNLRIRKHDQNGDQNMAETEPSYCTKRSFKEPEFRSGSRLHPPVKDRFKDRHKENKYDVVDIKKDPRYMEYHLSIMKRGIELFPQTGGISEALSLQLAEILVKNALPVELAFLALDMTRDGQKPEHFAQKKLQSWLHIAIKDFDGANQYEFEKFISNRGANRATYRGTATTLYQQDDKSIEALLRRKLAEQSDFN